MRILFSILLAFYLMLPASAFARPIGFQGTPAQFPYATRPLGPGFQSQFFMNDRFFTPVHPGLGFNPDPQVFPLNQDPRSRFFDPRIQDPTMDFTPIQRGF